MKKIILIFTIINSSFLISQTTKNNLLKEISNYIKVNNNSNIEKMVDYFPEFVFDSISKKDFTNYYKKKTFIR